MTIQQNTTEKELDLRVSGSDTLTRWGTVVLEHRMVIAARLCLFCATVPAAVLMLPAHILGVLASRKERDLDEAFKAAIGERVKSLEARLEEGQTEGEAFREYVRDCSSQLSPKQVEQLYRIIEVHNRSADAETLRLLQNALRSVVQGSVEADTRRAVLSHLNVIGPIHIRDLQKLKETLERPPYDRRARSRAGVRTCEIAAESKPSDVSMYTLLSVGFVDAKDQSRHLSEVYYTITPLGMAVLEMLDQSPT